MTTIPNMEFDKISDDSKCSAKINFLIKKQPPFPFLNLPSSAQQKIFDALLEKSPSSAFKLMTCNSRIYNAQQFNNNNYIFHYNQQQQELYLRFAYETFLQKYFNKIPFICLIDAVIILSSSIIVCILQKFLPFPEKILTWTRQCNCLMTLFLVIHKSIIFIYFSFYQQGKKILNSLDYENLHHDDLDQLAVIIYKKQTPQIFFFGDLPQKILQHDETMKKILKNVISTEILGVFIFQYLVFCYEILKFGENDGTPLIQYFECIVMGFFQGAVLSVQADLVGWFTVLQRGQNLKISFIFLYSFFVVTMSMLRTSIVAVLLLPFQAYAFTLIAKYYSNFQINDM
eukprot:TRINITY_DN822_c0_g2_i1.p1 TRINITY_DN822_c0_g2~~TRINITY_DN822_c0_g2_i1.p1  ORF type:complete len:343 (-),score=46.62 TRINITY_DN822_c0_g2_i1:681-1709(-)